MRPNGGTVYQRPPVKGIDYFHRCPTGGTFYRKDNAMTGPAPLEELTKDELIYRVVEAEHHREVVLQEQVKRDAAHADELASLRVQIARLDELDQVLARRNSLEQLLVEQNQEVDRLKGVLQEMVAGVTTWVPDLTPVPAPPPELEPAVAEAWVRDQIAGRRAQWDSFVNRVTTQAIV